MALAYYFKVYFQEKNNKPENTRTNSRVYNGKTIYLKNFFLFFLALLTFQYGYSQSAYHIKVKLTPYKNSRVYLGYYYGKIKALADSAMLDASSSGTFKGKERLPGGIYFIVSPKKEILFEILIDKVQNFSIVADSSGIPDKIAFLGSEDNTLFQSYTRFMAKDGKEIEETKSILAGARNKEDSAHISNRIKQLNVEVQDYRNEIEKKYPQSILASLLKTLKEPVVPAPDKQAGNPRDTLFAYHYFRSHYWDGISFTDERLIRTPIFEPKLDKYFKDLVPPEPDSINREADRMLLESRTNKEMFKYLLIYFVQKYINPEYMGQDAVFVHLFEKYINVGQADFFTEKYRKFVNDRAYSLMANLIGLPASNLIMTDTSEQPQQLYDIEARFTVICFWDPTCSHCKEIVPKLDSIYQNKWKAEGIKLVGVMVDGGKEAWLKFIRDHNLKDWIHVYQTQSQHDAETAGDKPSYKQLYDVYQTPILYLLDKDKRIIAKKLGYQQFDEVINLKLQLNKTK
jgi:thiol-disulfide isomerase/thioredoxin